MFHPLIFDNLRVVLEGAVYDRDFDGLITIVDRSDIMDLATFQRKFEIKFHQAGMDREDPLTVFARVRLCTALADIAAEQLQKPELTEAIGCTIGIQFRLPVQDVLQETWEIADLLNRIWGNRPQLSQTVKATLDRFPAAWPPSRYVNQVTLDFGRKIGEGNIEDLRDLLDHTVLSLESLQAHVEQKVNQ